MGSNICDMIKFTLLKLSLTCWCMNNLDKSNDPNVGVGT